MYSEGDSGLKDLEAKLASKEKELKELQAMKIQQLESSLKMSQEECSSLRYHSLLSIYTCQLIAGIDCWCTAFNQFGSSFSSDMSLVMPFGQTYHEFCPSCGWEALDIISFVMLESV